VRHLTRLVQIWQWLALLALLLALASGGWAAHRAWRLRHREIVWPAQIIANPAATPNRLPPIPRLHPAGPAAPMPGWSLRLDDRFRQSVQTEGADGPGAWIFTSREGPAGLTLETQPLPVEAGARYRLRGRWRPAPDHRGEWLLKIDALPSVDPDAPVKHLLRKWLPPATAKNGRGLRHTVTLPAGHPYLRVTFDGRFQGTVRLENLTLAPPDDPTSEPANSAPAAGTRR